MRQSSGVITAGHVIAAADINAEFNALATAFDSSVGHVHDGTTGEGQPLGTSALSGLTNTSSGFVRANGSNAFTASAIVAGDLSAGLITYAKIQNVAAVSLLGNPTGGATVVSGITLGATLAFNGTALQTAALTGDVTATANSFATTVAKIQTKTVSGTTGTVNVVFSTSPTLTTPVLGVASATTINKVTLTTPATGSTLTIADGKTLTANSSLTLAGTDAKTLTVSNSLTLAGTDAKTLTLTSGLTVSGGDVTLASGGAGTLTFQGTDTYVGRATTDTLTNKTLTSPIISTISNTGTLTLPTSTDTLVGRATTDTFTHKTYDTAGTGNVFSINGTAISAVTGTGSAVLSVSPTFTGVPLSTTAAAGTNTTQIATTAFINSAGVPIRKVITQNFSANGTYTPSTGMVFCIVRGVGGGGGSGGCATTGGSSIASSGGGGGGGFFEVRLTAAQIGASQTITIGAGGTAGAAGNNNGGAGGTTSIGTLGVCAGGAGGTGSAAQTVINGSATGGAGGGASVGDILSNGGNGGNGLSIIVGGANQTALAGMGGGSFYSPSNPNQGSFNNAQAGVLGSGATGGSINVSTGQIAGAAGGNGYISITEYCTQ